MNVPPKNPRPSFTPGERYNLHILRENGYEVSPTSVTVALTGYINGVHYITGTDLTVYAGHPLLDLVTGERSLLWVLPVPDDRHRYGSRFSVYDLRKEDNAPDPRIFRLPEIGLKELPDHIRAFQSPGSEVRVLQDGEGFWWAGDLKRNSSRPYAFENPKASDFSEDRWRLGFMVPYLRLLGPEPWWSDHWRRDVDQTTRLTFCTWEVGEAINKEGVWGFYYPEGLAQTDVNKAVEECREFKANFLPALQDKVVRLQGELQKAQEGFSKATQKVTKDAEEMAALTQTVETLTAANSALSEELEALRAKRASAVENFDPFW